MRNRVGLPGALTVLAALASPGCLACRPPAPLDDAERAELESIRGRLRAREVRIVAPLESGWMDARLLLRVLEEVRIDVYRWVPEPRPGDVTLQDFRVVRDFTAKEALDSLISTLTLYVVPWFEDGTTPLAFRWTRADGSVRDEICGEALPTLTGWVAPIVAMGDDWRFGRHAGEGSPEHHAMLARLGLCLARRLDAFVGAPREPERRR